MLRVKESRAIVLLDGALMIETKADSPTVSVLKGVGLSLEMHPSKALHLLQDGVIMELRVHEWCALHVICEKIINNGQMVVQRDSSITTMNDVTNKKKHIVQVMEEACRMVLELAIPIDELVDVSCAHL